MKVLLDTNIILDIALEREPFFEESEAILVLVQAGELQGYISASTVSDLYYILRKAKTRPWALAFLKQLFTLCQVATVDGAVVESALASEFVDFEDAIQHGTAVISQLDAIITRNLRDYEQATLSVLTPAQLIKRSEPM